MIPYGIDLLISAEGKAYSTWQYGQVTKLDGNASVVYSELFRVAKQSTADYLLLWLTDQRVPSTEVLQALIDSGLDLAHAGLKQGMAELLPDLQMVIQDWSMIKGDKNRPSSNWHMTLDACLIRRDLFLETGGLEPVFIDPRGAALEFGYRCMKRGALVEYRPELLPDHPGTQLSALPVQDLYCFLLRHYGRRWGQYVFFRRLLRRGWGRAEWRAWQQAQHVCATTPSPTGPDRLFRESAVIADEQTLSASTVSVIIPTLGRYPYIPQALESLRQQSVRPFEVIVVDQNPPSQRQPEIYQGYDDLNVRVIWQDERGQSLARNTGLAAARGTYVFLFDDDSIADEKLIEEHLRMVVGGCYHVSTGVAYPPPPSNYKLPVGLRHPRLAQTLDTGNCLLPLALAKQMGGLDRNYDFGPGTDLDFGTRLYLAGKRIVHNPHATRIHFKAPMGGLRTHGAHKYNTDQGWIAPFPPITQSYYALRYLTHYQRRERLLLQFVTSKFPKEMREGGAKASQKLWALLRFCISCILIPIKRWRSYEGARALLSRGVCLMNFEERLSGDPGARTACRDK